MSMQTIGRNGRVYQRLFDHDEARARFAAGESASDLAREYGVSENAIHRVVSPGTIEKFRISYERDKTASRCIRCGAATSLHAVRISGSRFCKRCSDDNMATSVGDGELRCHTCKKWKPDDDFPRNRSGKQRRRGRHESCRSCNTDNRRRYRESRKVPCIGCGTFVLPPEEKRTNGAPWPRCSSCAGKGIVPT